MDFAGTIAATLPELRRAAESRMTATVVVRRRTGNTEDPATFEVSPAFSVVYQGPAKVQTYEGYERTAEAAGATVTVQRSAVHFPVGAFASKPGDVVTVLAEPTDPLLVGRNLRLAQEYPVKSHATAYRVHADELVGEEVPPWEAE